MRAGKSDAAPAGEVNTVNFTAVAAFNRESAERFPGNRNGLVNSVNFGR